MSKQIQLTKDYYIKNGENYYPKASLANDIGRASLHEMYSSKKD